MNRKIRLRSQAGFTVAMVVFISCILLLPVGLYSFEVARSNLARTQLQAALDAATLAAASFVAHNGASEETKLAKARELAQTFIKRQMIMSGMLENTTRTDTVDTSTPAAGDVEFDLTIDANDNMHSKAVYGLRPAFAAFLGLTTQPIRVASGAGYTGLTGDICIVLDISDSLTYKSHSRIVKRKYYKKSNTLEYEFGRMAKRHPALGRRSAKNGVPDPLTWKIDQAPKLKAALHGMTREDQLAALIEAKKGNLESEAAFKAAHVDRGRLNGKITPSAGFQEDYQRLAVENCLGLADEKASIRELMSEISKTPGGHVSLVTFGGKESGDADFKDSFTTFSGHGYPHVRLSKENDNQTLLLDSMAPCLTKLGTDMKGGIRKAVDILTGDQHRPNVQQTIVLLTDGLPTTGSPLPAVEDARDAGIRIYAVGYYQLSPGLSKRGKRVLKRIVDTCGNGSEERTTDNLPTLLQIMRQIGHGTLALNNG